MRNKRIRGDNGSLEYGDELSKAMNHLSDAYEEFKRQGFMKHDFMEFVMIEWHCMLYDDMIDEALNQKGEKND